MIMPSDRAIRRRRILVTGATGFIGNHVVQHLLIRGHEVVAVARDGAKAATQPWFADVRFLSFDIQTAGLEPSLVKFGTPDALIHLAWPGLPNYKSTFHFEDNLPAGYRFIKTLVSQGLKQVLVTGTCFEYGMQHGCLTEEMPTCPANPYALAKDTMRKFLQSLQQSTPFTLQWARLFYMYGPGQGKGSLLAQLDQAIDRGDEQFNMSGGEQLRDYLPVEDVARRLVWLVETPEFDGVINVCSGEPISVRRLVEQHLKKRTATIRLNLGKHAYSEHEPMAFWGSPQLLQQWEGHL